MANNGSPFTPDERDYRAVARIFNINTHNRAYMQLKERRHLHDLACKAKLIRLSYFTPLERDWLALFRKYERQLNCDWWKWNDFHRKAALAASKREEAWRTNWNTSPDDEITTPV
jgi:hypothetical protein